MNSGETKVGVVRRLAAIVMATAIVVSVAACSDLPAEVQNCTPPSTPGDASKSITAHGAFGLDPKASVPTPTTTKRVETSTLKAGTGLRLGDDDLAYIQFTVYDGKTGAAIGSSGQNGYSNSTAGEVVVGGSGANILGKNLACLRVGSRSVTVETGKQAFGSTAAATAAQVPPAETLVFVTDVIKGFRGRATGTLQPLQSGFPSVVTSGNGTPGLTLDLQTPPKTAESEVIRKGSGPVVKAGQEVLLQVQGVAWTNPAPTTTFDTTWKQHLARSYRLTALSKDAAGDSLDKSSVKALVGQTVGSQILVVVPPKFGYPSGSAPSTYPTGSTLIFVYDIVGKL